MLLQINGRGQIAPMLENMGSPGGQSKVHNSPQKWLLSPLPVLATSDNVTKHHKLLCASLRNSYLMEALYAAVQKNAINRSQLKNLGSQLKINGWRPILDLRTLNKFLKIVTLETIRTPPPLQPGMWVTSILFKDVYFHIPIQTQARKYLAFQVQVQSCQLR